MPIVTNNKTFTQNDLAQHIKDRHEISISDSRLLISTIFDKILEEVQAGTRVKIYNFGYFLKLSIAPTTRLNMQTKEKMDVPMTFRLGFVTSRQNKGVNF
jgi:nucleoid DNA-binding protein